MCGLTGIINLDGRPVREHDIKNMTRTLVHRGPDACKWIVDRNIAFGHTRLSIIDLSDRATQPFQSLDGRYHLVYNGEIYNFLDIKRELRKEGYTFKTRSDTEVLLAAYQRWGLDVVNRLNGMFAFAVWDRQERRITLARDRYGIKPVYLFQSDDVVLFASEIKALLAHPRVSREMDAEGLAEYLSFQNFFSSKTLFKNIKLFPRASYQTWSLNGVEKNNESKRFWDYDFSAPETSLSDMEYVERTQDLIKKAVRSQLVSDVPLGSYLSGGIDSGIIAAVAADIMPKLSTFTCGFDMRSASGIEMYFDEREEAEKFSSIYKTQHYEVMVKAGDLEASLPHMGRFLEEPRVGQSYPNHLVAELASKFVKVVLSGSGGDELFGGYPWRYLRSLNKNSATPFTDSYYNFWQRLVPEQSFNDLLSPVASDLGEFSARDIFASVFPSRDAGRRSEEQQVSDCLYFEASTFLEGLLIVEDKLSMSHSLETRLPFLDNDLVDFVTKVPTRLKVDLKNFPEPIDENNSTEKHRSFYSSENGKILLRLVAKRLLGQEAAERKKQGFSAPDASWFKGESIDLVKRKVLNPTSPLYGFVDYKTAVSLVEEHLSGKRNRRLLIWSLLNLDEFCGQYLT